MWFPVNHEPVDGRLTLFGYAMLIPISLLPGPVAVLQTGGGYPKFTILCHYTSMP